MNAELTTSAPRIVTHHNPPPIPVGQFDWSAITEDYDGAEDARCPIGWGATEEEAIADLREQLAEREERHAAAQARLQTEARRDCQRAIEQMKVWDQVLDKLFGGAR